MMTRSCEDEEELGEEEEEGEEAMALT